MPSMYNASIPVFVRQLGILKDLIGKAEADAESRKIDPGVFAGARLAPDMFPLARQVQIATDIVKGGAKRLAEIEAPVFEDRETTLAELKARIDKTVAFLQTVPESQLENSEARSIALKFGSMEAAFDGQSYLLDFVLPNLFFHISMVYAILRHNGVPLGKGDFLGRGDGSKVQ